MCLTSVWNSKRWNKTKKVMGTMGHGYLKWVDWAGALQEKGVKEYVGEFRIASFKLPVLSCSQPLKIITGFKNTIYNVLALDRCSTCVTVLIYETKMVTVNYVFLCAFSKVGELVVGTQQQLMLVSQTSVFWWNIMEIISFQKKEEKNEKIWLYIFFLKQYISVWLVIEHFSFFR